jgi:hypothetical protein
MTYSVIHTSGSVNSHHKTKEEAETVCKQLNDSEAYLNSRYVVITIK